MYHKKIYQKNHFFQWVAIGAIALLLLFQGYSLFVTYQNVSGLVQRSVNESFEKSIKEYRGIQFEKIEEPISFTLNEPKNNNNDSVLTDKLDYRQDNLTADEAMSKIISFILATTTPVEKSKLDSLFSNELRDRKIITEFEILINPTTESAPENLFTPVLELDAKNKVQAVYSNPLKWILEKMITYLIFSVILISIIIYAFIYQLKIIQRQKKIEHIRQDFVDNMTHELKNPIQGALSLSEILQKPSFSNDENLRENILKKIKNNLYHLDQTLSSIIEKSYSENLQQTAKLEELNISNVIDEVIADYTFRTEGSVIFDFNYNSPVLEYYADSVHFPNAIRNLIDNAIKYSPKEKVVSIEVKESGENLILSISDRGIGIKEKDLNKIFDKFYRVKTDEFGLGLGLNYVKWVVEVLHKGFLNVHSIYGQGTNFVISIPIIKENIK